MDRIGSEGKRLLPEVGCSGKRVNAPESYSNDI